MKFEFIQELTEARMYRGTSTLSGKSAEELAQIVYAMILMLELVRYEDPGQAKNYAKSTITYDLFKTMRNGASDLYNLLAVLNNQDDYAERIRANHYISVPVLQLKKYFRDIENSNYRSGEVRPFMLKLETYLNINESWMKQARRAILYWNQTTTDNEKEKTVRNLKRFFQAYSYNNDLYVYFRRNF